MRPGELGLDRAPLDALAGGTPDENAAITRAILEGRQGPPRDVAVLNAGAAIMVAGGAADLAEGVSRAAEAIDSGAAAELLRRLIERTSRLSKQDSDR